MLRRFLSLILAAAVVVSVAACGSQPVSLTFGDKENPNRVTAVTGLESHDAANVVNYGSYTGAKATEKDKTVCAFEAIDGQTMEFKGVKTIKCNAVDTSDRVAGPVQAKSAFVNNAAAVGGLIEKATPALLGGVALSDRRDARASAERTAAINAETQRQAIKAQGERDAAQLAALQQSQQQALDATAEAEALKAAAAAATP